MIDESTDVSTELHSFPADPGDGAIATVERLTQAYSCGGNGQYPAASCQKIASFRFSCSGVKNLDGIDSAGLCQTLDDGSCFVFSRVTSVSQNNAPRGPFAPLNFALA